MQPLRAALIGVAQEPKLPQVQDRVPLLAAVTERASSLGATVFDDDTTTYIISSVLSDTNVACPVFFSRLASNLLAAEAIESGICAPPPTEQPRFALDVGEDPLWHGLGTRRALTGPSYSARTIVTVMDAGAQAINSNGGGSQRPDIHVIFSILGKALAERATQGTAVQSAHWPSVVMAHAFARVRSCQFLLFLAGGPVMCSRCFA
jgi:hypothetical protein